MPALNTGSEDWPSESKEGPHGSPLRSLIGEATGSGYTSFDSLSEARRDPQGVVILEGDDGGQIYAVAPARLVTCTEEILQQLLVDLDEICWPGNDPGMRHLVYERLPEGEFVAGGMGGGEVTRGVWVHSRLDEIGLADEIRTVLTGSQERLRAESRELRT